MTCYTRKGTAFCLKESLEEQCVLGKSVHKTAGKCLLEQAIIKKAFSELTYTEV